jgi:hypothetical protein
VVDDRQQALTQATQRRRGGQAKLDRAYDDYLEGRLSEGLWMRKSGEWEVELATVDAEIARASRPTPAYAVTADRILELAKTAHSRYIGQSQAERRRLLDTVLSNCTFDRGSLRPTYTSPFDLLSRGRESGDWRGVWDGFRTWAARAA